jgi:rRNA maturation protein Nop10
MSGYERTRLVSAPMELWVNVCSVCGLETVVWCRLKDEEHEEGWYLAQIADYCPSCGGKVEP